MNKDVLDTINFFPDQLLEAWEKVNKINIPENYQNFKHVLVCGMGGSALGARVVKSLAFNNLPVSIEVVAGYSLPLYAQQNSLVIASSYSGNTEETISCLEEALAKNFPIFVVAAGGELVKIAQKNNLPVYVLNPKFNPSNQPRFAVGYSIGAIIAILANIGVLDLGESKVYEVVDFLRIKQTVLKTEAEKIANSIKGKVPILIASEHLVGSAHVFKNQINESAKTFSVLFDIPELNHHLMEGLKNPAEAVSKLAFIFFESHLYHERIQKRYTLTKDVVEKNNIQTITYRMTGESTLEQVFELIQFGSYSQMYLSAAYGEDPISIPWVDYFKQRLEVNKNP